jgi:hypothetical protein
MTPQATKILQIIRALRAEERRTGMVTTRTQRHLLKALMETELIEVVQELQKPTHFDALRGAQ